MNYQTNDLHIQAVREFLDDATKAHNADLELLTQGIDQESSAETLSLLIWLVAGHLAGKRDLVEYLQPYLSEIKSRHL